MRHRPRRPRAMATCANCSFWARSVLRAARPSHTYTHRARVLVTGTTTSDDTCFLRHANRTIATLSAPRFAKQPPPLRIISNRSISVDPFAASCARRMLRNCNPAQYTSGLQGVQGRGRALERVHSPHQELELLLELSCFPYVSARGNTTLLN